MNALAMRLRSEFRARWRAWLGLALMFGVASGAAITAAAGARRTDTAYPRFVRANDAFHAFTGGGAQDDYEQRYAAMKAHALVADASEILVIGGELTIPERRSEVLKIPEIFIATDPAGRALYETHRANVVEGRLADRSRPEEVMVPFTLADRLGINVGDELVGGIGFDFEEFPPPPAVRVPLHVVGIVAAPGDFETVGQQQFGNVYATPALLEKYRELIPPPNPDTWNLAVHLRGGPSAAALFKETIERDFQVDVPVLEPVARSGVQKTMRLYVAALWLVAVLIASATLAILGQTLVRQQLLDSEDYPALRALGLSRRQMLGLGMLRAALTAVVAAVVAVAVAYLLSPLTPIGPARIAEPDPGFAFDATAIGIGAAAVLILVPALALIPAWRASRISSLGELPLVGSTRPSRIVEGVSRTSGSAAALTGLRMALEPGSGRTAVPVRSTILAVALGIAAVSASVMVGRSLTNLIDTPALAGFTYDAILPSEEENPTPEADAARERRLRSFPFVEAAAIGTAINSVFDGVDSFIIGFEDATDIGYAVIEGRAPTSNRSGGLPEIAPGPATMRRLGLRVGNTIRFGFPAEAARPPGQDEATVEAEDPAAEPLERREFARARIVGVAAIPSVPWAITEPGEGGVMSTGGLRSLNIEATAGCCFVRFRKGTDLTAARKQLETGGFPDIALRTERADLATLERISRLPGILSVIFGAISAGALIHVLVTGIRRRRRDLAILKTLGFVRGQVRGAVAWQSTIIAVLAAAVGIPAGIALGRWGWRLVAAQFGVVPVSIAPALFLGLLVPAAVLLANVVAAVPGRIAARTRPALVLRTE